MRFFNGIIPVTETETEKSSTYSILSANLGTKVQFGPAQSAYPDAIYSKLEELTTDNLILGHAPHSSLGRKYSYINDFRESFRNMNIEDFTQKIPEMLLSKPEVSDWRNFLSDDYTFMLGSVTASEASSFIGVDLMAYHCLNKLMGDSEYKIKSGSSTFRYWSRFFHDFRNFAKSSQGQVIVPVTITMNKKSIRGEFVLNSLHSNAEIFVFDSLVYPASFTHRKRAFREFDNADQFVKALNAILEDFHRRQIMAKDYLAITQSKLMSKETFGKVFNALQPYISDGEDDPTWEFDKLMGGRNPVRSVIGVRFQNSPRLPLQMPMDRCSWCNFPISIAFTQQSLNRINASSAKIRSEAALATDALREEHEKMECRGKRNTVAIRS